MSAFVSFFLRPCRLYNATMTSVKVGNATLNVSAAAFYNASNDRPDAIFDTGSDLIALPGLLYNAIFVEVRQAAIPAGTVAESASRDNPVNRNA